MWHAFLVDTTTGRCGARLQIAASGSWSIPLNGVEEWSVTIPKAQWTRLAARWQRPWATSILMCWEEPDGDLVTRLLGPIVELPETTKNFATLKCKGVGAILEKRVTLAEDFHPGEEKALVASKLAFSGMSLGTIAQEVVKAACRKTGGSLPIVYRSPRETGAGLNERTYEGFNLANIGAWKLLTELSEVANGPDFAFRPEWATADRSMVRWGMWHGTKAQPTLVQTWWMELDTTAPEGPVADYSFKPDSTRVTHRHYQTGAGEGAGTLVKVVEDIRRLYDGMPLIETVESTSDSDNPQLVASHAAAALRNGADPLIQLSMSVDATDPRALLGRWNVGDLARVTVADEFYVPDGTRDWRIIAASGSWDSTIVNLEFQEEYLHGEEA